MEQLKEIAMEFPRSQYCSPESKWRILKSNTIAVNGNSNQEHSWQKFSPKSKLSIQNTNPQQKYFKVHHERKIKFSHENKLNPIPNPIQKQVDQPSQQIQTKLYNFKHHHSRYPSQIDYPFPSNSSNTITGPILLSTRHQLSRIIMVSDKMLKDSQSRQDLMGILDTCKENLFNYQIPKQMAQQCQKEFMEFRKCLLKQLEGLWLCFQHAIEGLKKVYECQIEQLKQNNVKITVLQCKQTQNQQYKRLFNQIPELIFPNSNIQQITSKIKSQHKKPENQINQRAQSKPNKTSIIIQSQETKWSLYQNLQLKSSQIDNVTCMSTEMAKMNQKQKSDDRLKAELHLKQIIVPKEIQKLNSARSFQKIFSTITVLKESMSKNGCNKLASHQRHISALAERTNCNNTPRSILKSKSKYLSGKFKTEHCL